MSSEYIYISFQSCKVLLEKPLCLVLVSGGKGYFYGLGNAGRTFRLKTEEEFSLRTAVLNKIRTIDNAPPPIINQTL
jgi:hypothetical protein